jgi:uncharacterized protein YggT (Ycf19 family)
MLAIFIIDRIFDFILFVVFVWVILSWVVLFASRSSLRWRNRGLYNGLIQADAFLSRVTFPLLRPFRRMVPAYKTGGIDWSPLLLLLAIYILRYLIHLMVGLILFR